MDGGAVIPQTRARSPRTAGKQFPHRARLVSESGGGGEQFALVSRAGSYLSAGDKRVHFGLGADEIVERIELTWPSGIVQTREKIKAGQVVTMKEPAASEP